MVTPRPRCTTPLSGSSCVVIRRNNVVFPAPLGPTKPTRSPLRRCQLRSRKSCCPPNDSETLISCNMKGEESLAAIFLLSRLYQRRRVVSYGLNGELTLARLHGIP